MHRTAHRLLFLALLVIMASLAYGINYMYFSTSEMTPFGDRIRFWHLDTLNGPIRTNGQFSIMQNPVFFDLVIQSEFYIDQGAGYSPYFLSEFPPVLNAPELPFPETASVIRERAFAQGFYFNAGPGMQAWILILEDTLRLHWAQIDEPFDTLVFEDIGLPAEATVFIDASLRISGTVSTVLTIGAGGRIGLDDNIRYVSSSAEYPWPPTPGHTEKLALVSENQIKVLNTPANGRDNCGGPGPDSQPDINLKDIVISGILVAMNESFTFENQNDADSGYQGPYPDERGTVYLWGSLMHRQRNYVHRSNHGGSGYNKIYRYDEDLRHWDFGLFDTTYAENRLAPESIDFGTVLIGQQARDTVRLANDFIPLGLAEVSPGVAPFLYDHFVSCPQPSHPDSICLECL